jgi:FAD/FMN-containing dehydrogenase
MPLDLGAKGSCQIGGNLATAAGGLRFLRYKSLHSNILGLKVVLSDGRIMDNIKQVRKDNTGYHMDHLFIGSEGTLGIITEVALQVPVKPKSVNVVLLGVENFENCVNIFKKTKTNLDSILSAYEFFDSACLETVLQHMKVSYPLEKKYPFYILIETHGSNEKNDETVGIHFSSKISQLLLEYFEDILSSEIASDGVLAQDESQVTPKMNSMQVSKHLEIERIHHRRTDEKGSSLQIRY